MLGEDLRRFLKLQVLCPVMLLDWPTGLRRSDLVVKEVRYNNNGFVVWVQSENDGETEFLTVDTRGETPLLSVHQPNWLTPPRYGSAGVGVFLAGLPGLVTIGPLMWLFSRPINWKATEEGFGSARQWRIWRRLAEQMTPDSSEKLKQAIIQSSKGQFSWKGIGISISRDDCRATYNF